MSFGRRPLVKRWDKPRHIRVITPSRYEQNEASVKEHWKNVLRTLELSYKDEKFWETQSDTVREFVGPVIFKRIAKIFNFNPIEERHPSHSETSTIQRSQEFYDMAIQSQKNTSSSVSDSEITMSGKDSDDERDNTSEYSDTLPDFTKSRRKFPPLSEMSFGVSKSYSYPFQKSFPKMMPKTMKSSILSKKSKRSLLNDTACTLDDLEVHPTSKVKRKKYYKSINANPHYDMLYCNKSETDMIKWKSKYKQKTFELSASDEFSKKEKIIVTKIAKEFYDWWASLEDEEFKSEIKHREDIEDLFKVWFDEHAFRGLVLDPVILPCVLQSIANNAGLPEKSCSEAFKRQIYSDLQAERSSARTMAFGACLPHKSKYIPPRMSTDQLGYGFKIPEDLRSMACVWNDEFHIKSTQSFHEWLQQRPHLTIPPYLKTLKHSKMIPFDYIVELTSGTSSIHDMALPMWAISIELKTRLRKLLNY